MLKTLCGFIVSEIAHALLANEDSIERRLGRARKLFRFSATLWNSPTLCIDLALLLSEHSYREKPRTFALLTLLCFLASRLHGRINDDGGLLQLEMQDRSKWDRELIGRDFHFPEKASIGSELSEYHLEATIASFHCAAPKYEQTDWAKILELYDLLYTMQSWPIVALDRAIAVGKALGPKKFGGTQKNSRFYPAQGLSLRSGGPR